MPSRVVSMCCMAIKPSDQNWLAVFWLTKACFSLVCNPKMGGRNTAYLF
jgi:hypothetical protein